MDNELYEERIIEEMLIMLKYSGLSLTSRLCFPFTEEKLFNDIVEDMRE